MERKRLNKPASPPDLILMDIEMPDCEAWRPRA